MKPPRALWVVAGDAGGANALWPTFPLLRGQGVRLHLSGYALTPTAWRARGEEVETLSDDLTVADAAERLRASGVALLLTGTSLNGVNLEHRFLQAARGLGVRSLALLDFWSNYWPRFSPDGPSLERLPDRVAIMDSLAREEMCAAGFPAERLRITGQPLLDDLESCRQSFTAERRRVLRHRTGSDARTLVLFVSQPLAQMRLLEQQTGGVDTGFDEETVIPVLLSTLERLHRERPLRLIVLPHPRESRTRWNAWLSDRDWADLAPTACSARELVLAAELTIGMHSMLLVESVWLGCATLSVQLGLQGPDRLPVSRAGVIPRVERADELEGRIRGLLYPGPERERHLTGLGQMPRLEQAARRVSDLVMTMISGEER
ncbi:MAG: hypothetical protein HQM01_09185 [Magnetococcales bacterium]|nr:hypothetical protein [Magnetococcales bacterium]